MRLSRFDEDRRSADATFVGALVAGGVLLAAIAAAVVVARRWR